MAPQPEERALYLSIYLLTILTGFPTNLLALHALIRKLRHKATPNCILLLNLTLSDLCFLAFLPFKVAEAGAGRWPLPAFLCPLSGLFYFTTIYSSTLFLTAVSVERYLAAAYPIHYKLRRRPAYAALASLGLWLCSLAHCSIVYVTELQPGGGPANATSASSFSSRDLCYDDFGPSQLRVLLPVRLELGIVLFLVPSLLTSFCYCGFVWVVVSSPHIRRGKKQRAVGLVAATLAVFIVCFTPYNLSHVVGFVQRANPAWRDKALLLSTFNASLDPIIFYFSSSAVQHSCRRFLARLWGVCSLPPLARKFFYRRTKKLTPGQPQEQCRGLGGGQVCCSKL
ncbi:oxidoreductase, aldo/keto reductase family protein [Platysternon megacephalum]|uniref:Oxidoreductase, aldo/keto reductase family protein n=1 Tax=Platysternon megacephalum TaxID=55544 RepID=A0A4D9DHE3_9SAUR|nr:oxidoreductase, aldo/keto reductase family protein [Platysternon megacephalum]